MLPARFPPRCKATSHERNLYDLLESFSCLCAFISVKGMMTMTSTANNPVTHRDMNGVVHCPLCTHRVPAVVEVSRRSVRVKPGQRCARCNSALDAGYVLQLERAA